MKAILPVAGNGTRMFPLGMTTPKALMPILNKPLIEWTLESLVANDISEVVIIISAGKFGTLIKEYVEKNIISSKRLPLKIHFSVQEQQLGTAHVLQQAVDFIGQDEEFVFVYGDDLYGKDNIAAVASADGLAVVGNEVSDPEKWGIFATDDAGRLVGVVEKPQEFVGNLANIGCMKLSGKIFSYYAKLQISVRGEYELTDSLEMLAKDVPIAVIKAPDYWIPIGYPWHILDATEHFMPLQSSNIEGEVAPGATQKGILILPKSSSILPGCYLDGNILVGENVTIGPNARIRGNTVLGDSSHVGFGVDLKNSIIGENSMIPHLSIVADSIIGKNCNISGGSVIANLRHDNKDVQTPIKGVMTSTQRRKFGAVIGDNVKLGIQTSIYPGRKIGPNLTTKPGQVVDRDLVE